MVIGPIVGGKKTTTEKEFVLTSKGTISQNKSTLKQVLYKNGYIKLSETDNTIQFKRKSALMGELVMSRTKTIIITATFSDENIRLEIVQNGNFKNGTNKKVEKTFLEIKNEYEKIN
jgi:hypothetical protein